MEQTGFYEFKNFGDMWLPNEFFMAPTYPQMLLLFTKLSFWLKYLNILEWFFKNNRSYFYAFFNVNNPDHY
jgi:hypothetical protein